MNFIIINLRHKPDMFSFVKNHPFAVEAFFESSLVFTFAVLKEEVQPLLPECLEPDSFEDKWAFIAVAMVQTKNLRPKGFPEFMGNDSQRDSAGAFLLESGPGIALRA